MPPATQGTAAEKGKSSSSQVGGRGRRPWSALQSMALALLGYFKTGEDQPLLGDRHEIDRLYRRNRLRTMLAITAGYGLSYTCRLGLSVVKKPLIDGGIFSAEQLGVIGSAIFYAYACGKLVNGCLADHANMKRFLTAGVLASALINVSMGWSTRLWLWVVLWALNGWFQGFGAPGGIVTLSQWFSNRERGRYYGVWSTAHSMGEGLTFAGLSALATYFAWQAAFLVPGIVCVGVALAVYLLMQDRPRTLGLPAVADWKDDHGTAAANPAKPETTWHLQLSIFKSPAIWVLAFASASMYMTRYAVNSWGMLYLQEAKGYSALQAGGLLALNPLAGFVGCVAYGFGSDKLFGARRPPMNLICGLLEILALAVIFFGPSGHPVLLTLGFLLYGLSLNGLLTALGGLFAVDLAPKRAAGAAAGFIGVFSYIGAALEERVSGSLIGQGTTIANGLRKYDFHQAVLFWVGMSLVSLVLTTSLWRAKAMD